MKSEVSQISAAFSVHSKAMKQRPNAIWSLGMSTTNFMQTLKRRSSPCKYKNDPSRFLGEGITFKAKLIGILEVSEARGDKMCQDALNDLKTAIRAAGEHKQRITINISIDGLRLRDEKTGDCLYHHPVHKISFIAQDMSDSRAFGYIFGSPDTGHRFFGIKTDKTASQVVISMRDLFQVVFELKKKEIEMSKHYSEQHHVKYGATGYMDSINLSRDESDLDKSKNKHPQAFKSKCSATKFGEQVSVEPKASSASEAIADLLDLEQGINQINKLTCSDPFGPLSKIDPYDPFDDSFSCSMEIPEKNKTFGSCEGSERPSENGSDKQSSAFGSAASTSKINFFPQFSPGSGKYRVDDSKWFTRETQSAFEKPSNTNESEPTTPPATSNLEKDIDFDQIEPKKSPVKTDLFTDLDPLGTGRVKPYIDKKDFFQELKNPPKKVLRELITDLGNSPEVSSLYFPTPFADEKSTPRNQLENTSGLSNLVQNTNSSSKFSKSDPFTDKDPFAETDPFGEESFSSSSDFLPLFGAKYSLEGLFQEKVVPWKADKFTELREDNTIKSSAPANFSMFSTGILKVSLPPEDSEKSQFSNKLNSPSKTPDEFKMTMTTTTNKDSGQEIEKSGRNESVFVEEPFMKSKPANVDLKMDTAGRSPSKGKFSSRSPPTERIVRTEFKGYSSSDILNITTPDPPPRTKTALFTIKPPPLPPKKSGQVSMKPPARPPSVEETPPPPPPPPLPHYDYLHQQQRKALSNCDSQTQKELKCMKLKRDSFAAKNSSQAFEAKAISSERGFPVWLPPPRKKTSSDIEEKSSPVKKQFEKAKSIPKGDDSVLNIKLTQLDSAGLENIATTLGIPSGNIYNMTLQDLTKMLAENYMKPTNDECDQKNLNVSFEADFDSNFSKPEAVNQAVAYDKYAVFKELVESENQKTEMSGGIIQKNDNEDKVTNVDRDKSSNAGEGAEQEDKYEALRQLSSHSQTTSGFHCENDEFTMKEKSEESFSLKNVTSGENNKEINGDSDKADSPSIKQKDDSKKSDVQRLKIEWTNPSNSTNENLIFPSSDQFSAKNRSFTSARDSWATFEKPGFSEPQRRRSSENFNDTENSPFSSDGKEEEREISFRWPRNMCPKMSEKNFSWRDDDESWDECSPRESLCSDESSKDERSPERHYDDKSWEIARRRQLSLKDKSWSDKSDEWSIRNWWQEETEDEFEETWRKHREKSGSYESKRRVFRRGSGREDYKKKCSKCEAWVDDWDKTARQPLCCGVRRKRSESDNEYRRRCDSDASDKECVWTFQPESARIGRQKQYHSLVRFFQDCPGHYHESKIKQNRNLGQKRVNSISESKRKYEMMFPCDVSRKSEEQAIFMRKRNIEPEEFFRFQHRELGEFRRHREWEKKKSAHRIKSCEPGMKNSCNRSPAESDVFGAFGKTSESPEPKDREKISAKQSSAKAFKFEKMAEGEQKQRIDDGADVFENKKKTSKSLEPSSNQWATTNGRSNGETASPNLSVVQEQFFDFKEQFAKSPKKLDTNNTVEDGNGYQEKSQKGTRQDSSSLLKKSDSINIFSRDQDPFEGDDFFSSVS